MSALAVPEREDVLVAALNEPDPSVRARAASGLGRFRAARAVRLDRAALEQRLKSGEASPLGLDRHLHIPPKRGLKKARDGR